jgi:hypothetical protein
MTLSLEKSGFEDIFLRTRSMAMAFADTVLVGGGGGWSTIFVLESGNMMTKNVNVSLLRR